MVVSQASFLAGRSLVVYAVREWHGTREAGAHDRQRRGSVEHGLSAAEVSAAEAVGLNVTGTVGLSVAGLAGGADMDGAALLTYIRERYMYGNHSAIVIQILTAWEAYGELFHEWRSVWESDSDEYRLMWALRLGVNMAGTFVNQQVRSASRRPLSRDRDLPSKKLSRTLNEGEEDSCEESKEAPTPVESKGKTGQTMTAAPTSLYLL